MKTTKIISILSLAMIFLGVTPSFSKKVENQYSLISSVLMIRYQVNVHLATDKPICNYYWVQITDENGRLVAPAQIFIPGKNQYTFYSENKELALRERGTKRVAMLIKAPIGINIICLNDLSALPDIKTGLFLAGLTYSFDLFPVWESQTAKD